MMNCVRLNFLLLSLATTTATAHDDNALNQYYAKVEECIASEKTKPAITESQVSVEDFKYLSLIRGLRIADCAKAERINYIKNESQELKVTISDYNEKDLSKLSKKELSIMTELDKKLGSYSLETDLLSLYDKLKAD